MEEPPLRPYKPSRSETGKPLNVVGADYAYDSGRAFEHDRWVTFLKGIPERD